MKFSKLGLLRAIFTYFGRCPATTRRRWGRVLGWLAPKILRSRTHIVRTNLALSFPELPAQAREEKLHQHFYLLAQSVVDRGLIWFGEPAAILEAIEISGLEHLDRLLEQRQRILMLAPHFIALDAAGTRISMHLERLASFYTHQSDPDFDRLIHDGRTRFNEVHLISRKDGIRGLIRHLRDGIPVYYLPDMDFGREGAVFVPFFGVPASTLTATAQIAKSTKAAVLPIVSRLDAQTGRYHIDVLPPLENFPGELSMTDATAHLSHLIETWVRRDPSQYYWVHRRYKTRPLGEKKFY